MHSKKPHARKVYEIASRIDQTPPFALILSKGMGFDKLTKNEEVIT
jgi:hypothetical protein